METRYVIFLAGFLILLLANGCSAVDVKENVDTNSGLDPKSKGKGSSNKEMDGSDTVVKSAEVDEVKEHEEGQGDKPKESVNIKKNYNSNKEEDSKEIGNMQKSNENKLAKEMDLKETENRKSNDDTNEESRAKEGDNGKGNFSDDAKTIDLAKAVGNVDDSKPLTDEGNQDEKCDSSNKCMDDGKNFVACLRVPGNDSPALSLLIQSKVKSPLSVTISAPEYVQLKETEVQLKESGHIELMLSVKKRGSNNVIMFKAKNGNCSLDFGDLIAHNWEEESDNNPKSTYFSFMSQKSTLIFISLAGLLILAAVFMCTSIHWKHFSHSSSNYQRLDLELPVSGAQKVGLDANDGWDNSWGDDWDDEEAPKTPSMPVTPSVSSKGLASRRLNKEGWKD